MTDLLTALGDSLLVRGGGAESADVNPSDALDGKITLLYFSAHWCPPCKKFTPILIKLYNALKAKGEEFELIFVSLDKSEAEFKGYIADMPWLCVPFAADDTRRNLSVKYKAQGIPHLVVLDKDGSVITMDGRSEVTLDETGEKFPWRPPTFAEIWPDSILTKTPDGTEAIPSSHLADKYLMLYFSAHWCPPCRAFTPKLSAAYTKLKSQRQDFELVFVSSDRDQASFDEYWGEMTFAALPFEERGAKNALSKRFEVRGIPTLIMVGPVSDGDRPLINDNVRSAIEAGDFSDFPFHKKPYGDLAHGGEDINEKRCLIVFHENGDDDEQAEVVDAVKEAAARWKDKGEEEGEINFYWATQGGGLTGRVRQALGMDQVVSEEPMVVLLDIPDGGGYYVSSDADVNVDSLVKFIEAPGERRQLGGAR